MITHCLTAGIVLLGLSLHNSSAQLAITEAMSSASTNNTLTPAGQGPDFWELTKFGTNAVDLTGYRFNDADAILGGDADSSVFNGVTIGPGESIIFAQNNTPINTRELFIQWWGAAQVTANLQVFFYTGNGFSSGGDSIVLWDAAATDSSDTLDRADFGEALRGSTFRYNTTNAAFGLLSSNGVAGAFPAATSDDVGSPGQAQGPVALSITMQPTNLTGYVGFPVTLHAAARGLPPPRYQWRFNGNPIEGANRSSLTITNVQSTNAGTYSLEITNGLELLVSSNAVLTVDASPAAPAFITTPKSIDAYIGQSVTLSATAQGNPAPSFQWKSNAVPLLGQTGNQLALANLQTNDTAVYSVLIYSLAGSNSAPATVTVTPKPRLLITEVQSTGSTEFQDWWEVTSFDTRPINLKGYRFDDDSQSLASAVTLTNDIVINPGESVIFAESTTAKPMTPAIFRSWWGSSNLPANLKIGTYTGAGVGLGSGGDAVYLWNAAATDNSDFVCGLTFGATSQTARRSFVYDPDNPGAQTPIPGSLTLQATNGVNGAFAASNGDVGSPGWLIGQVQLNLQAGGGAVLSWNSVVGRNYTVQFKDNLSGPTWLTLSNLTAASSATAIADAGVISNRFYRAATILPFPAP